MLFHTISEPLKSLNRTANNFSTCFVHFKMLNKILLILPIFRALQILYTNLIFINITDILSKIIHLVQLIIKTSFQTNQFHQIDSVHS